MSDIVGNPCQSSSGEGVCVSIRMRPMNEREVNKFNIAFKLAHD